MTTVPKRVRRRASRADLTASRDGNAGKDGKAGRIEHVPELQARPTLSVATIRTEDVPTILREPPSTETEVGLLRLVSAIDGRRTSPRSRRRVSWRSSRCARWSPAS